MLKNNNIVFLHCFWSQLENKEIKWMILKMYLMLQKGKKALVSPYSDFVRDLDAILDQYERVFDSNLAKLERIAMTLERDEILREGRRSGKISGGRSRSRSPIRRR
jgi:hypothetical protein